jgi:polyferredoxin/tetratricopeptide (TPR) repeat protein
VRVSLAGKGLLDGRTRRVSLPQVVAPHAIATQDQKHPSRRTRRIGHWRAASLIALHLLIIAHILHWWMTGDSIGRFVLSDSMRTLELGEINPGFVLFIVAIALSLLAGRFLCGWACHMGALQDLAGWLLRRFGLRPHFFRARLLALVPVALAFYMFVWPTLNREIVAPLRSNAEAPSFPGWSVAWSAGDLLEILPGPYVSAVFLFVSGVATVCFLGARGLCRYVCPYGGFLLPAQTASLLRVKVDPARCDQCGLCTAACTAGVRVHEEVGRFGHIRSMDCIRSLDCIEACPRHALSLGFSPPGCGKAVPDARTSRPRYDLSLGEEFACLAVFILAFWAARGYLGLIPMLMAASIAVIVSYLAWKTWRLIRDQNVGALGATLRRKGRPTLVGYAFASFSALVFLATIHGALMKAIEAAAARHDDRVQVSLAQALAQEGIDPRQRESAEKALVLYNYLRPLWQDGIAPAWWPQPAVRAAYLHLVVGERERAISALSSLVRSRAGGEIPALTLADLHLALNDPSAAESVLRSALESTPSASRARAGLARLMAARGDFEGASNLLDVRLGDRPNDPVILATRGELRVMSGRIDEGIADLARAARLRPRDIEIQAQVGHALAFIGRTDESVAHLLAAAERMPYARSPLLNAARHVLAQAGRIDEARQLR